MALDIFDSKIHTHIKGGYACGDHCRFGNGEITVAPGGRLYPCARLVGDDTLHELVIGHAFTGIDQNKVIALKMPMVSTATDLAAQNHC